MKKSGKPVIVESALSKYVLSILAPGLKVIMKKEKPPFTVKGSSIMFKEDVYEHFLPRNENDEKLIKVVCKFLNEGYRLAQRDQHEKEQKICEKYGI